MSSTIPSMLNDRSTPDLLLEKFPGEILDSVIQQMANSEAPAPGSWDLVPSCDLAESDTRALIAFAKSCDRFRELAINSQRLNLMATAVQVRMCRCDNEIAEIEEIFGPTATHRTVVLNMAIRFVITGPRLYPHLLPQGFAHEACTRIMNAVDFHTFTLVVPSRLLPFLGAVTNHNSLSQDHHQPGVMPDQVLKLSVLHRNPQSQNGNFLNASWYSVVLNEGSSQAIYTKRNYYARQTPSIIYSDAFTNNAFHAACSSSVREFHYVAIYPLARHVSKILQWLEHFTNLQVFKTRLTPGGGGPPLFDPQTMAQCQLFRMRMQLEASYVSIASFVYGMGAHNMREFWPLDDGQSGILTGVHERFKDILEGWTLANNIWSKTSNVQAVTS